jgi:PAS domain S-box-containing protein
VTDPSEPADAIYRRVVENSQGLICVHDLSGVLLYTNPASASELGYSVDELVGRNGSLLLAPSVRPLFRQYLERIRTHKSDQGVLRLKRRDGTDRLWAYRNVLHEGQGGDPYVIGHAVDITEHWRTQQQLRESETRSRAVLAALDEGVVFCGADGEVVDYNRSAERILGATPDQLLGSIADLPSLALVREDGTAFPSSERPSLLTLRTGRPCLRVVCGVRRGDDVLWLELTSQPLARAPEEAPYGVVVSFTDVTERRSRDEAREAQLREAMAKLKILGGLLPICASCKKIRDQEGAWHQLETYIHNHSQAQFSHGLCPTCLDRLYPPESR